MKTWCVYIIECVSGALYTGITNDLEARFAAHQEGRGAKFTKAHGAKRIVTARAFPDRSVASKVEYMVKQRPRSDKARFLEGLSFT